MFKTIVTGYIEVYWEAVVNEFGKSKIRGVLAFLIFAIFMPIFIMLVEATVIVTIVDTLIKTIVKKFQNRKDKDLA